MAKKSSAQEIALRDAARADTIDKLGTIEARLAPHAADIKAREKLRGEVRAFAKQDEIAPGASVLYQGKKFAVALGPRENERRIRSIRAVYRALGIEKFLAIASVTLKKLEEALPDQIASLVEEDRTGSRDITVTPL